MSAESDAFKASVDRLKEERDQIIPFITDLQTRLVAANEATAAAIAAGLTDKEVADAARAAQPDIVQIVTDLDQFTPAGTPLVSARRKR